MKKIIYLLAFMSLIPGSCKTEKEKANFPGISGLIHRVVPRLEGRVVIDSIAPENGKDVFEISSHANKIILAGSSPVAVASALNWYLKYTCHCQFSQAGQNLELPEPLPMVKEKVRISSPYKYRYFLNYCTFDYTMAFWGWDQWQRELDWMAMQGINLVLAINGTEEVWQNVMKRLNFTDKEISDFICGPAYQAWWLMDNLEGWGGPVSREWIESRTLLQKKILAYMNDMGMQPILQGFYGMVPTTLKKKFPKADIRPTGEWCQFTRPDFVVPTDTSFQYFAGIYYQELEKLYGKAHFYGGDPFHEGTILNVDLPDCGRNIQQSMQKASPGSTWVLQGWIDNPSPKLLQGVDTAHTMVIDLFCESDEAWKTRHGFEGCRWLYCTIDNFGGRTGLYGKIDSTTRYLGEARKSDYGKQLEGMGIIPEGINLDPFIFDYIFELGWHDQLPVPEKWAEKYPVFRYGKDLPATREAWKILSRSVYNIPMHSDEPQDVICSRPTLKWTSSAPWGAGPIQYKQADLENACNKLLSCAGELKEKDSYRYDAVDMVRQYLMGVSEEEYHHMINAYDSKNKDDFETASQKFLNLIQDMDTLVSTRKEFLLGRWIKEARDIAPTENEKDLFERNARMLITTWGYGKSHEVLNDYAHREWGGLLGTYYYERWQMFVNDLKNRLNGKPAAKIDYAKFEENWTRMTNPYPDKPSGDAVRVAENMFRKYSGS